MILPRTTSLVLGALVILSPASVTGADDRIARRIAELASASPKRRARAAAALRNLGPPAAPRLSPLVPLTRHEDPGVRRTAVDILGAVGVVTSRARTALTAALHDGDVGVRRSAAKALGGFGVERKATVAALEASLVETTTALRERLDQTRAGRTLRLDLLRQVAEALGTARRATSLAPLRAAFTQLRAYQIALAIAKLPGPEARRFALDLVADPKLDTWLRSGVAQRLLERGAAAAEVQRALKPEERLSDACVYATVFKRLSAKGIARLRVGLRNLGTARRALTGISALGPKAGPLVGDLADLLDRWPEYNVVRHACWTLGSIGAPADLARPQLIKALTAKGEDTDSSIRGAAAEALGEIGRKTPAAVQGLIKVLREPLVDDHEPWVKAARALGRLKAHEATAVLVNAVDQLLDEDEDGVGETPWPREVAVEALGAIGPRAKLAVPRLTELAKAGDLSGAHALLALRRIEGKARTLFVLAGLKKLAGTQALMIAPGLLELKDPALTRAVVALVQRTLRDAPLYPRLHAIQVARRMGAPAQALLQATQKNDPHLRAREAAAEALRDIRKR